MQQAGGLTQDYQERDQTPPPRDHTPGPSGLAPAPHQVLYGQLEVGDLSQRLVVPLDLVHALRQVLGVGQG